MGVIFRQPWTRQPQGRVGVAPGNPIARGLIFAWNAAFPHRELVNWFRMLPAGVSTGLVGTPVGAGVIASASGSGWVPELSGSSGNPGPKIWDIQPPLTVAAFLFPQGSLGNNGIAFGRHVGSGTPNWVVGVHTGSSNGGSYAINNGTNAIFGGPSSDLWQPLHRPVLATLSIGSSTHSAWWGRLESKNAVANPAGGAFVYEYSGGDEAQRKIVIGSSQNLFYTGATLAAFIWNRELSYAEHVSLSDNPWQLFAPISRKLYVDVGVTPTSDPSRRRMLLLGAG